MVRHATLLALVLAACSPAASPPEKASAPVATVSAPPMPSAPPDAGVPPPPRKVSKCKAVGPNQISEDDHPQISGVGAQVEALEWLDARGVSKNVAIAWFARLWPMRAEEAGRLGEAWCHEAKVGDDAEEAMICRAMTLHEILPQRLFGVVVRKKQPAAVFAVGLGLGAMDFPEAHHLDLAFRLSPDGKAFDLADWAPDGTELVLAPSLCRRNEQHDSNDPDSPPPVVPMGYPATLHDCEGSKKVLASMRENGTSESSWRGAVAGGVAFATKTCKERGHYRWDKDRFVRDGGGP